MRTERALKLDLRIRVLKPRDMSQVLAIEEASFQDPWTARDFSNCLGDGYKAIVCTLGRGPVIGYAVFDVPRGIAGNVEILNLAVAPEHLRQGVGSKLVEEVKSWLPAHGHPRASIVVMERNVPGQLFLRALGFRWKKTLHRHYEACPDDAYVMIFRPGREAWPLPANRIRRFVCDGDQR